ncbi:acVLRF1 family peptidyl-tRNA hydrolase [Rugosimonospora acidiphila]|uniref:AcVLRF1 family peptidyl-tRNA hydrolase n=1 Tax=Rugosimonospora acidiphila TaxID=556531 RepID=A0ABP9S5S2_9ACTN
MDPDRMPRWLSGFAQRHGDWTVVGAQGVLDLRAEDGASAECHASPGAPAFTGVDGFLAAVRVAGPLGLLLARRGAVAVGVAEGDELAVSKVDSRYVQGRTAAGGWSQQRFARRRENQARAAAGDASDLVARLLLPRAGELVAVVTGGDRRAVDAVLADPRLGPVAALRAERFLDVPEPKLAVLEAAVRQARAVRIRLVDP